MHKHNPTKMPNIKLPHGLTKQMIKQALKDWEAEAENTHLGLCWYFVETYPELDLYRAKFYHSLGAFLREYYPNHMQHSTTVDYYGKKEPRIALLKEILADLS